MTKQLIINLDCDSIKIDLKAGASTIFSLTNDAKITAGELTPLYLDGEKWELTFAPKDPKKPNEEWEVSGKRLLEGGD